MVLANQTVLFKPKWYNTNNMNEFEKNFEPTEAYKTKLGLG